MVGRTSSRRASRWAALGIGALVAASGVGCSGDTDDTVVAAPSALADAAEELTSGRIEVTEPSGTMVVRFEGEDSSTEMVPSDDEGAPGVGELSSLTVDGTTYATMGGDGFVAFPTHGDDEQDEEVLLGDVGAFARGMVEGTGQLLRSSVVDQPGERTTVDGVEVTRYRASLDGAEAIRSLEAAMLGSTGGVDLDGAEETRSDRIDAYLVDHMEVELVGDVDDHGNLRTLTMTTAADLSEYPDCEAFDGSMASSTLTVSEINEPQHIEAPPPDRVRSMEEFAGEVADEAGLPDVPDDVAAGMPAFDGAQPDIQPDAAADQVRTATGGRTRAEVLDYLRRWAEAHDIDWRRMAIPDDTQMVAWFDQFYADDLATRGPELHTALGPYPRGYLVEVVDELDPSSGAAALDDATLVAAYEAARGAGLLPSTSDRGGADVPIDSETVVGDDDAAGGGPTISDSLDAWEEEYGMYEGCPG